ncbi:MAG: hypothetical protein R3B07_34535 [Polyangiaceae bacterium]
MRVSRLLPCLGLLALSLCAGTARAELVDDVSALKESWSKTKAHASLPPRLVERGDQVPIGIPQRYLTNAEECTSVVVLSAPNVSFVVRIVPNRGETPEAPEASVAGLVQLVRCGERRSQLGRLLLEMRSPRGVVETVFAAADAPLPAARRLLKARDPGPVDEAHPIGPPARAETLPARVGAIRDAAFREGALEQRRLGLTADGRGAGGQTVELSAGCYRIDVLSAQAPEGWHSSADVDLDVRRVPDGALVVSDRGEALDAHVELCTASPGAVRLSYSGGFPHVPLLGLLSRFAFPGDFPKHWSDSTKNQLALLLHEKRLGSGTFADSGRRREWLGVAGVTRAALQTQAGACYTVVVAAHSGIPGGFALVARQKYIHVENQSNAPGQPTFVQFCAKHSGQTRLEVEAQGGALIWRMIAYRTGSLPAGGE